MHASELCRHGSLTVLRLAGRANQGLAWGAEEPWLLQRRTRAPCGGCWPGRCNPQAQPILPAVSVGPRDAARGSPSTTRRTRARSTRNGGLSTKTPGDARRRTHRDVRWRIWTCSRGGSAASSEPSAAASRTWPPTTGSASCTGGRRRSYGREGRFDRDQVLAPMERAVHQARAPPGAQLQGHRHREIR
jgi:hypothetical protein